MKTYVALLRGVNVGGNKMVPMAELRALIARLGFADVKTLLQSGNAVFSGPARAAAGIERLLEAEIAKRLKLTADVHVRDAAEWSAIVEANPFRAEAKTDPGHLLVTFFRSPLEPGRVKALQAAITGREVLEADGRHLYMVFPDGVGNSKAVGLIDKTLGARGTARNWNTVLKLAALLSL